eukprot:COSAG04_NODE_849_length_9880_cov_57.811165_5_plen_38_part_00
MIREKVAQRSKNVNDTRAAIQVRTRLPTVKRIQSQIF